MWSTKTNMKNYNNKLQETHLNDSATWWPFLLPKYVAWKTKQQFLPSTWPSWYQKHFGSCTQQHWTFVLFGFKFYLSPHFPILHFVIFLICKLEIPSFFFPMLYVFSISDNAPAIGCWTLNSSHPSF